MLRALVAVLRILWLLGFVRHIGGSLIHALAVVGVAVLLYDAMSQKKERN